MYENAEIQCQKGHTATQYITTPLSLQYFCPRTVYRGGQFYWWWKPQYPKKTTDLSQVTNKIYHIRLC
jgi:hypothetical protein